jgi:drug/metabolite transporter (DMT)-like permease
MLGIVLALASSVAWGTSDFLGGMRSRRISALTVLLVSQPVGLALALGVALGVGGDALSAWDAAIAAGAGAAVVMALAAFYRAMALGSVTVVATIGALGVLVPVVAGLLRGDRPNALQALGAIAAIAGAVFVAREPDPEWRAASTVAIGSKPAAPAPGGRQGRFLHITRIHARSKPAAPAPGGRQGRFLHITRIHARSKPAAPAPGGRQGRFLHITRRPGLLAALAALGFGIFLLGLDVSSGPQPAWTIVAARIGGVATLLVAAAFARPSMRIDPSLLPSLFVIGFFDVLANSLFAVATNHGLLALVAVAGSLYSAVTVLLARFVLGERLALPQRMGVVVALAGAALIAAGS